MTQEERVREAVALLDRPCSGWTFAVIKYPGTARVGVGREPDLYEVMFRAVKEPRGGVQVAYGTCGEILATLADRTAMRRTLAKALRTARSEVTMARARLETAKRRLRTMRGAIDLLRWTLPRKRKRARKVECR